MCLKRDDPKRRHTHGRCDLQTRPIATQPLRTALIQPSHRTLLRSHGLTERCTQPNRGCTSGCRGRALGWNQGAAACTRKRRKCHTSSWGTEKAVNSIANDVLGDCGRWAASDEEMARRWRGGAGKEGRWIWERAWWKRRPHGTGQARRTEPPAPTNDASGRRLSSSFSSSAPGPAPPYASDTLTLFMTGTPVLPLLQVVFEVRVRYPCSSPGVMVLTSLAVDPRSLPRMSCRIHPCKARRP